MLNDITRALDALQSIPADLTRNEWVTVGMAAQAAGLDFDAFNSWSSTGSTYSERDARDTWRSFKPGKGIGAGTLYKYAKDHGWSQQSDELYKRSPTKTSLRAVRLTPSQNPDLVWDRCKAATDLHPYIVDKKAAGAPLEDLRVVPDDDNLQIAGESMAGALVVPVRRVDETISSLQFIAAPDVAKRLKTEGRPGKLNLPGCQIDGWHTVGKMVPGCVVFVCEGIGQAWACMQSTGHAAVVSFGAGRIRAVAVEIRKRDANAKIVIVPDVGKEHDAEKTAIEVGAKVVKLPDGWPTNADVSDLVQRDGRAALASLLQSAIEIPKPQPRYKLLGANDLRKLPPLAWRVRGVLPAVGLAGLYGPSASGKSFLALDLAAAIAAGDPWFDCRVEAAPVVYCALEGEGGFKLRVAAWEAYKGCPLPDGLFMLLQQFRLTETQDIVDLASVVPHGSVLILDTLNRAAPTADENSSKDMGEILSAAKQLQAITQGLVIFIHHTGKDANKGLRGHSSLFAALDAAVEVTRNGDRRQWKVAKSKDGKDGDARSFSLNIETLGIDEFNDPITSCVVAPSQANRDLRSAKLPQGGNQKLVLDALRELIKTGEVGRKGAPPLCPSIELELAIAKTSDHLHCEKSRRITRTKEAITGLIDRGVLGCNEGWIWML
jgi:putative DNA primase/helicase